MDIPSNRSTGAKPDDLEIVRGAWTQPGDGGQGNWPGIHRGSLKVVFSKKLYAIVSGKRTSVLGQLPHRGWILRARFDFL